MRFVLTANGLTVNELSLLLNNLVAQVSVLLKALHHKVFLSDHIVFEQSMGLHLCILDLQLVDLAEKAEDLALLLRAYPPRQQLLQASGLVSKLQKPTLKQRLWAEGTKSILWERLLSVSFLVVDEHSYLLLMNPFLFSRECNQIFSSHPHLLGLRAVWRRLGGIRVLLAFILNDTFLPPLCTPFSPAPASLLLPAKRWNDSNTLPGFWSYFGKQVVFWLF